LHSYTNQTTTNYDALDEIKKKFNLCLELGK